MTVFAQRINWLVETEDVREVEVNGEPAALVVGGWDYDTSQWDKKAARMLNRMKGKEMYQLHSPGAAVEDLIRMAESIPQASHRIKKCSSQGEGGTLDGALLLY